MPVADQELDYEHHLSPYRHLLSGDIKQDAYWYEKAQHLHALTVIDAILSVHLAAVPLAQKFTNGDAETQLKFGVGRRTKSIWLSLRSLTGLVPPDRRKPLIYDDVAIVARDLNVIYINIRGALDNYAWCLLYLLGNNKTKKLPPMKIHLFGKDFLADPNLTEVAKLIEQHREWSNELKERRDPVAHRIPLSVPPAVLDQKAQNDYADISDAHSKAFNAAVKAASEGSNDLCLFDEVEALYERLQGIGQFAPLFDHHPDEGNTPIYPTVPQDIGILARISLGLNTVISASLEQ